MYHKNEKHQWEFAQCAHPKNMHCVKAHIDLASGEEIKGYSEPKCFCSTCRGQWNQESGWLFRCIDRLLGLRDCGSEARWFKPKEK